MKPLLAAVPDRHPCRLCLVPEHGCDIKHLVAHGNSQKIYAESEKLNGIEIFYF